MPLLILSPLPSEGVDEDEMHDEAESLGAEAHSLHLEETFKFYKQDVSKWALCSIADSCSVNKLLVKLLRVPHVGCKHQKLSSEVKDMVRFDKSLERTVFSVHDTVSNCKRRLTNLAMLRNLTYLMPTIFHVT